MRTRSTDSDLAESPREGVGIIAGNLSKAGWNWGWRRNGQTIFVADAHRDDGKRFVVRADDKLAAFAELEAEISHVQASAEPVAAYIRRGRTKTLLN